MSQTTDEPTTPHEQMTFEQAMHQLEALVAELERDDVGLEQSLKCYEEGVTLARQCLDRLDKAELRVRELSLKPPEIRA